MREIVRQKGLEDVTVVNTCAVTAEAVRKSRQAIRRMHRERPGSHLVATGCAVQIDSESFNVMAEVDTILGNSRKLDPEAWDDIFARRALRDMVPDIMTASSRNRMISGFGSRSRAQIQIQNGCDHRCTFCIIPYGRGNSRSVALADIVEQAQVLSANGYNEIVLSGVDITAWGTDLPDSPLLGDLVQSILDQVSDLRRLRVSSVDPVELDDQFVELMATDPRLMPHLHLSVQSGDNLILKRMKRRHAREDVIELCAKLAARRPDITFGADLIAGFPTETETMFDNSLRLVEECNLTWLHIFPYSQRQGTPAARMPQVDSAVIHKRASMLRQLGQFQIQNLLKRWVGRAGNVLMETPFLGRAEQFAQVEFAEPLAAGQIIEARFVESDGARLAGVRL